jgi:multiple sugar transport system permease protein
MNTRSARQRWQRTGQAVIHLVLILICLLFVLPFLYMFLASFKPALEIIKMPPTFFPKKFTLINYQTIFERLKFWRYFLNSIITSGSITVLAVFTSSLAGFVFTKFKFPGKEIIFVIFLAGLMIPFSIIVMPMYLFVSATHMQNTYLGLILPLCVSPFGIFLMRQFMEGIPTDMVEAAKIDGANNMWIYTRVIVPLAMAGMGAVAVFTFLWSWNQLWWPLMVISKEAMRTLPLGVAALTFQIAKRYDMIVTGASLAVAPVMVVFVFAQRTLIKGMMLTGLKM